MDQEGAAAAALSFCSTRSGLRLSLPGYAPERVADVIGREQGSLLVDHDADRPSHRIAMIVDESGEHVDRLARWLVASERHVDDFVTTGWFAIPRPVLADEHAVLKLRIQSRALREDESQ